MPTRIVSGRFLAEEEAELYEPANIVEREPLEPWMPVQEVEWQKRKSSIPGGSFVRITDVHPEDAFYREWKEGRLSGVFRYKGCSEELGGGWYYQAYLIDAETNQDYGFYKNKMVRETGYDDSSFD
jgi:hypothetical protein